MKNVVVITGASSGIGYELAKLYHQKRYVLVLSGRNKEGFEGLTGEGIDIVLGDLTEQIKLDEMVKIVKEKYGKVDIL